MNKELSNLKCQPCSGKTQKLNDDEILLNLDKINEWNINDDKEMIFKKFKFKNFKKAILFTNLVADLAENENHHPDISFGWGYCLIMMHTHAIKGLSLNDFILAAKIDEIHVNFA